MPNHTLPEHLTYAPELLWIPAGGKPHGVRVTKAARILFFQIWMQMDNHHRLDIGPSPENPVVLRSKCHPAEPDIRIPDVARSLEELRQSGAVAIRDSDRGWYVEIAERLRYRREDYKEGQPKYGPRHAPIPTQGTLPLCAAPAPPRMLKDVEPPDVPRAPVGKQEDRLSFDSGHGHDPDSARGRAGKNRATGRGEGIGKKAAASHEPGRFARDEWQMPGDEHWGTLCRLMPLEMVERGAHWVKLWREKPDARRAIIVAMLDWLSKTPDERQAKGGNAGAYIQECYGRWNEGRAA